MNINSETVLNGTNQQVDTSLGQIRVIETNSGLTIEHQVTKRERLYSEYSNFAVKTAQSTVEMCRVVSEAKKTLSSSEYSEFLNDIGHKSETSTIRKHLAIGEQYDKLIQYTNLLPNSWTSIYTITQLGSDTFNALAATDTDMSKMSGKEIKTLLDLNKPKPSATSASAVSTSSVATTQTVPTSSVQSSSDDKHDESLAETDVEQVKSDSVNSIMSSCNNQIDVVSTDGTYEVLVRFKSKPSDDSWWDLTEAIDAVVDERGLNVEVIETRPPFAEVLQ
jgi:membrane-associated HD superfamily phosphohydrolase